MKPRLGDDIEDGWLLLGGPGMAQRNGPAVAAVQGGRTLSAHEPLNSASPGILTAGAAPVRAGGPGNPRPTPFKPSIP